MLDEKAAWLCPALAVSECPTLMVCSQLSTTVQTHAGTRLLLYPDGSDRVVMGAAA